MKEKLLVIIDHTNAAVKIKQYPDLEFRDQSMDDWVAERYDSSAQWIAGEITISIEAVLEGLTLPD